MQYNDETFTLDFALELIWRGIVSNVIYRLDAKIPKIGTQEGFVIARHKKMRLEDFVNWPTCLSDGVLFLMHYEDKSHNFRKWALTNAVFPMSFESKTREFCKLADKLYWWETSPLLL